MPSYVVTGANRGIGLAFVRRLSENKDNIVIGLVRTQPDAETISDVASRDNLHWVHADLENRESINAAVPKVSAITGGKLDVLIANAGIASTWSAFDGLSDLVQRDAARVEEELLTLFRVNCVAQIFLITAFLPLIKAGTLKKVVGISTGFTIIDLSAKYGLFQAPLYSVSKMAFNMAITKLYAEHKNDGVLVMAVEPGIVDTGMSPDLADAETAAKAMRMMQLFMEYAPHFKGPSSPEQAVGQILDVVEKATFERNGGQLVSHFGNDQWL